MVPAHHHVDGGVIHLLAARDGREVEHQAVTVVRVAQHRLRRLAQTLELVRPPRALPTQVAQLVLCGLELLPAGARVVPPMLRVGLFQAVRCLLQLHYLLL